jgi:hypothetical protein
MCVSGKPASLGTDTYSHSEAAAKTTQPSAICPCCYPHQYAPDQVEPDDPSLGGKELLRKGDGERARDPHGLLRVIDQLSGDDIKR